MGNCKSHVEKVLKLFADNAQDDDGYDNSSQRNLLLKEWPSLRNWFKQQPLDNIKEYFGPEIALRFAWSVFYTCMLIPPSIFGVLLFVYGLATLSSDYLLDNVLTLVFAVFMCFWASLFLKLWKRYSSNLIHRWGLTDFNQIEHPRPQYLGSEPQASFWKLKLPAYLLSFSVGIICICILGIIILSCIVYRTSQRISQSIFGNEDTMINKIILPVTAALIDYIVISILEFFYSKLAVFLTNIEYRRTQTKYDESLTIKMYLFKFVNYYSSLFYIAFIKGSNPGGCFMDLCLEVVKIMIGKPFLYAIIEMFKPYFIKMIKPCLRNIFDSNNSEYLKMALQYGCVVIFAVALPLAPLCALLSNIVEILLYAFKLLKFFRRPVAKRVENIGVWFEIMSVVNKIAIVPIAYIIAFLTNFVPKLVYKYSAHNNDGYSNFTRDFQEGTSVHTNVTMCHYLKYINLPSEANLPLSYWQIFAFRLGFFIIFPTFYLLIQWLVDWTIPDTTGQENRKVQESQLQSEASLTRNQNTPLPPPNGDGVGSTNTDRTDNSSEGLTDNFGYTVVNEVKGNQYH